MSADPALHATVELALPPGFAAVAPARLRVERLAAWHGARAAVTDVTLAFPDRHVTALVGPSGCGKSTLLRCLNRLHEMVPGARVRGAVYLDGRDVYARGADAAALRRRVGMVFARPTPFPARSVRENVALALPTAARGQRRAAGDAVERALERVGLWAEVRDRLEDDAARLSGGQQQRLCLARALAAEPDVLLFDEPTAALDPLATQRIEELLYALQREVTVLLVTHSLQQAARAAEHTAFLYEGRVVEFDASDRLFTSPRDARTEAYITGRFG